MAKPEMTDEQARVVIAFGRFADEAFDESILHLLYDIDEGELPVEGFYVAETRSDWDEGSGAEAAEHIDKLCRELGIDALHWAGALIERDGDSDAERDIVRTLHVSRRMANISKRLGESVGKFLTDRAYDALPIELDRDGSGNVELNLRVKGEHVLRLRSEGYFTTDYYPGTEEDDDGESEISFSIRYLADVEKTKS